MKTTNDNDLQSFLVDCHVDTGHILNLAESLQRSVKAIEFEDAICHPDRILIDVLTKRIAKLNELIGNRL